MSDADVSVPDFLPIVIVVACTMVAGILLNAGVWFVVIKLMRGLVRHLGVPLFLAVRQLGWKRSGNVSATAMGGFWEDLKRKILGTKSHVVMDRPGGVIEDVDGIVTRVRAVDGVVGVSPYVQGEVMIRSAINIGGAVLRGIDPASIGKVSNLGDTIEKGKLDYLERPDRILPESIFGRGWRLDPGGGEDAVDRDRERGEDDRERNETKSLLASIGEAEDEAAAGGKPGGEGKKVQGPVLPGLIIGREMAKNLNLYVGDEVKLIAPLGELGPTGPMPKSRPYRVAAVFFSGMYEYDAKNAYVTLESGRKFLGIPSGVTGIEIKVKDPDRVEVVAAAISRAVKPGGEGVRVRHWKELNRSLFSALFLEKIGMFIMLSVIVLIAYLIIVTTLYMMVMEKTRDIAVLKTLGCSDSSIYRIFQIEGLVLGLSGTLTGVLLGVAQTLGLERFGVPLDPEVHYISTLPVQMKASEVVVVALASLVMCLLITILPARRASRLTVVGGLRFK